MPTISDDAVDQIIESCNRNARGAIQALLLVNEQLETELRHLSDLLLKEATLQPREPLLYLMK